MMIVDTSVWIDHLRAGEPLLVEMLGRGGVLMHPFVLGELSLGNLQRRRETLFALQDLPVAEIATDEEVRIMIERRSLAGKGIGYVDAHLLASVQLTPGSAIWTHDRRLATVAEQLGLRRLQ